MDCARLSDAELLLLIRGGGESSPPALRELEQRHFPAVQAFAAISAVQGTDQLAHHSWQAALRQQMEGGVAGAGGAIRPSGLSSVLHTASGWARGNQRMALNPQLAAWIEANGPVMPGNTATAGFRMPSLVARAYAGLPDRSQTILWHQMVERDDPSLTGRLIGSGPREVSASIGRAQSELYQSYVRVLWDGMQTECRHYQRLVMSYADTRAADIAPEVRPHLERCARCSTAVADLGRIRHDCGGLLAEALLPWGAQEYVSRPAKALLPWGEQGASEAGAGMRMGAGMGAGMGMGGAAAFGALNALPAGSQTAEPAPAPSVAETASHGSIGRHSTLTSSSGRARAGSRPKSSRWRPNHQVVRYAAVGSVCAVGAAFALAFAFGFGGDSDEGNKKNEEAASQANAQGSATKAPKPPKNDGKGGKNGKGGKDGKGGKNGKGGDNGKGGNGADKPPPPPAVSDSATVEWLFGEIDGNGVAADTSGNDKDGTLFGNSRPTAAGGGLKFNGRQFVAARGPLVDTGRSFTVSARVTLDSLEESQTIVSQDSSNASAFMLQYDSLEEQWEMRIPERDVNDAQANADEATSNVKPEAGVETHLTGVYSDASNEIRLYVNGELGQTVEHADDFKSAGSFVAGRGLSNNEFFQGVDGTIDDVRAFPRALSSAEVKSLDAE